MTYLLKWKFPFFSVLSRRRFNYHLGWQYTLDHYRAQIFLYKTAKNIRTLIFAPMLNFFNLFEVMNMLSQFSERYPGSLDNIHTLKFTFNCDMAFRTENAIYGTGGQLLQALKNLMSFLPGLTSLELTNLLLDSSEALYLLDDVCYTRCLNLHSLTLINCTKAPCRLLHPGAFLRLHSLRISPQTLSPDLLWLISSTKLKHLHVIQNAYTESCYSIEPKAWSDLNRKNPALRVHLKSTGKTKREIVWQERAPVSSVLYNSRYSKVNFLLSLCRWPYILKWSIIGYLIGDYAKYSDDRWSLPRSTQSLWSLGTSSFSHVQQFPGSDRHVFDYSCSRMS